MYKFAEKILVVVDPSMTGRIIIFMDVPESFIARGRKG
jgi:hypothetical protein